MSRASRRNSSSPFFKLIEFTTAFPCTHLSPASITLHFELSIMIGIRAISGSLAIKFKKRVIAASESIIPSSMLTSSMLAPPCTCCRATASAPSKSSLKINFGQRIGQTGIRISADVKWRHPRQLFDEWSHFIRAERTIQPDNKRLRVRDRDQKRFHGLAAQRPARLICHRSRNNERKFFPLLFEDVRDRKEGRLTVQRVEDCFDQEKVDTSFDERTDLIEIRLAQLIECDGAKTGIIQIGRNGCGHGEGTDRSADEPAFARLLGCSICRVPRNRRGCQIHFANERAKIDIVHDPVKEFLILPPAFWLALKKKIVETNRGRAKRVGFDDIGPCFEVNGMNFLDHLRLSQVQQLKAALEIFSLPVAEFFSTVILLRQFSALDHRAHGAVEHDDAFAQELFQRMNLIRHAGG